MSNNEFINNMAARWGSEASAMNSEFTNFTRDVREFAADLDYLDDESIFNITDDSSVDAEKFKKIMKKVGGMDEHTIDLMFEVLDAQNGDGYLDKEELLTLTNGEKIISRSNLWFSLYGMFDNESVAEASENYATLDMSDDGANKLERVKDLYEEDSQEYQEALKAMNNGKNAVIDKKSLDSSEVSTIAQKIYDSLKTGNPINIEDYKGLLTESSYEALVAAVDELKNPTEVEETEGNDTGNDENIAVTSEDDPYAGVTYDEEIEDLRNQVLTSIMTAEDDSLSTPEAAINHLVSNGTLDPDSKEYDMLVASFTKYGPDAESRIKSFMILDYSRAEAIELAKQKGSLGSVIRTWKTTVDNVEKAQYLKDLEEKGETSTELISGPHDPENNLWFDH